jgi:chaperonin GroEL
MAENTAKGFNPIKITNNLEGLKAMEKGLRILTKLVKLTYGPKGYNVLLERKFDSPLIINDASTICNGITFDDHLENLGAQFLKDCLLRVKTVLGDGATTTAILLEAMISLGIKYVAAGGNPILVRKGMEKCSRDIIRNLSILSNQVDIDKEIRHLAKNSSSNDKIALLIEQAVKAVGKDGTVIVGESKKIDDEVKIYEGIILDRGFVSNLMAKDTQKMETHLNNTYLYITEKKLTTSSEVIHLLEKIKSINGSLLIIAESIEGEALSTLVTNQIKETINVVAIQAPDYGEDRHEILEDIAALTGGINITSDMPTTQTQMEYFGRCQEVIVTKKSTYIMGGRQNNAQVNLRIKQIEEKMKSSITQYEKEKFEKRVGNLLGKIAFINIGVTIDTELGEKIQRTKNAINTVNAGLKYGVVPGGGSSYVKAASMASGSLEVNGDEIFGVKIVLQAIEEPARQLLKNADINETLIQEIIDMYKREDNDLGYDIETNQWIKTREQGLIDSYQVVKTALEIATSMAAVFLTTKVVITDTVDFPY